MCLLFLIGRVDIWRRLRDLVSLWLGLDEGHHFGSADLTCTDERLSSLLQRGLRGVNHRPLRLAFHAISSRQRIHLSYSFRAATRDIRLDLSSFLGITERFSWKFSHKAR